jgi:hypothetical protein
MATTVTRPLDWPLVKDELLKLSIQPLFVGDDLSFRFQFRDSSDAAVDITNYTIEMEITVGGVTIIRSSANTIAGSAPSKKEIEIDAGQGSEVGDTGRGWYQCNFTHYSADVAIITTVKGVGTYKTRLKAPSTTDTKTHFAGTIEIL